MFFGEGVIEKDLLQAKKTANAVFCLSRVEMGGIEPPCKEEQNNSLHV
jgi:hypothetical protein